MLGGLVSSKIIALFLGPGGIALTGNLRDFQTLLDAFSTLGFQNGVIKYVAENEKDNKKLSKILTTVFATVFVVVALMTLILLSARNYWSTEIFGSDNYSWIIIILALSLPFYAGNVMLIAILNGLSKYNQVIKINIIGNIIGVTLSAVLIWQFNIEGALLGVAIAPALLFIFSFFALYKRFSQLNLFSRSNYDAGSLKNFFSYSLMTLVTMSLGAFITIAIRNNLIDNYGLDQAGLWGAMNRLSTFYLMFASTLLTVYFLPKLSTAQTNKETKQIFWSYYKGVVPVFALGLIVVYFLKEFIVRLLFSKAFVPMTDLFFWQLAGDFLKVASMILAYEFFAKKMVKSFVVFELISYATLYISSHYLITLYGSEGAVMAHALTYLFYFILLLLFFRKKLL